VARRNRPHSLLVRFYEELIPGVAAMNRRAREKILAGRWRGIGRVLELACGNGATAVDLARKGLDVEALDLSPAFVREARRRARAAGVKVRVRRGDMRRFEVARPVDLVLCEFSALNELDDRRDLGRVLRAAARALVPGGLLLFDVNTPRAMALQYTPASWFEHRRFKLVIRCRIEEPGRRARLDLEWFVPAGAGLFRHRRETFRSVCWTTAELRRALRDAGFGSIRVFDGIDVRPRTAGATRGTDLYFLARRSGAMRRFARARSTASGAR